MSDIQPVQNTVSRTTAPTPTSLPGARGAGERTFTPAPPQTAAPAGSGNANANANANAATDAMLDGVARRNADTANATAAASGVMVAAPLLNTVGLGGLSQVALLEMQRQIQLESQMVSTAANTMKAQHDAKMAVINAIRS